MQLSVIFFQTFQLLKFCVQNVCMQARIRPAKFKGS